MAHAQKQYFVFRRNGRVHLTRRGASVQSTTGSRGVRISGKNAGYTMQQGSVKQWCTEGGLGCLNPPEITNYKASSRFLFFSYHNDAQSNTHQKHTSKFTAIVWLLTIVMRWAETWAWWVSFHSSAAVMQNTLSQSSSVRHYIHLTAQVPYGRNCFSVI